MAEKVEGFFTKFPNELLQALQRTKISGCQFQVALTIVRLTYGFPLKPQRITYRKLMNFTGLSKNTVAESVQRLIKYNIVERLGKTWEKASTIHIQPDFTRWEKYIPPPKSYKSIGISDTTGYGKTPTGEYANSHTEEYAQEHTHEKKENVKEKKENKMGKENDLASSTSKLSSRQETISGLSQEEHETALAEKLKKAWNDGTGDSIPKVMRMVRGTPRFKKAVALMQDGFFKEHYEEVIKKIGESDFLSGKKKNWKANFNWFIESGNFDKIIEGNYDNRDPEEVGYTYGEVIEIKDADI